MFVTYNNILILYNYDNSLHYPYNFSVTGFYSRLQTELTQFGLIDRDIIE
jgi:hypothetical protein